MKMEFWKHQIEVLFLWPFAISLSISCAVVGIILTCKEAIYWPIIAFAAILLVICIYGVFFQESTLSKIVFSEEKILLKRFGKIIKLINWDDIVQVKGSYYGRGSRIMTFVTQGDQIDVMPTKKMYNAIILLCPHKQIINMINNIEQFKWFHNKSKD